MGSKTKAAGDRHGQLLSRDRARQALSDMFG
jgi:hypothetical protein